MIFVARNTIRTGAIRVVLTLFFAIAGILSVAAKVPSADPAAVLPTELIKLVTEKGEFVFTIEVADEGAERELGLMFRKEMLPTHGMLFDFGKTGRVYMWMKDTPLSLDMVFIKPDGQIAKIERATKPGSLRIIGSGEPVSHVLELNAGTSDRIGLKAGDRVVHDDFN